MQNVLMLLMLLGMLVFILFWALFWIGQPVEQPMLISMGVVGTATGLLFIGKAVMPSWERDWWKPHTGRPATVRLGRVSSLAAGIWFTAIGVAFLGYGWLTEQIVPGFLAALAIAIVLTAVGMRNDRRDSDAAWAAVRQRGWAVASGQRDEDFPADEAQRRRDTRKELCMSIQDHLTGRTTMEEAETRQRQLAGIAAETGSPNDGPRVAEEWRGFLAAFTDRDEIWEFNSISARRGPARGEEGFARLRRGIVEDWFIAAVVG